MAFKLPLPNPDRWNNLNTTTSLFLLNAVLTAFTCGVVLGIVLLCGFRGELEISSRAESILNSWLMFLTSMWGAGVGQFWVKRKTHGRFAPPVDPTSAPAPGGAP